MNAEQTDAQAVSYRYERRAQWSDCDPAGIVFFAQYARWMSDGLIEMLLSHGIDPTAAPAGDRGSLPSIGFTLRFRLPVRLHERVTHEIRVIKLGRTSLEFGHRILNRDGACLVEGEEKRVWVELNRTDGTMKAVPIPDDIRRSLEVPSGTEANTR